MLKNTFTYNIPQEWKNSGTNLVYFGDLHWRKNPPRARIDDFKKTELNKIYQIRLLAKQSNAKAILQPGDFLDVPKEDDQLLAGLMNAFGFDYSRNVRKAFDAGKIDQTEFASSILSYIPIIGLVGNHELTGGSLKSYDQSSLKMLSDAGFLTIVSQDSPYIIKTKNGLKIAVTGANYDNTLLPKKNVDLTKFSPKKRYGDVNIFMVHEALYNTQFNPEVSWLPISMIQDSTLADITIAGHIHYGFGWIKYKDKLFGNPGALAQQSISANELDREVTATIIHINDDGTYLLRDFVLAGTKPMRQIADLKKEDTEDQVASMLKLVDQSKISQSLDPAKIVEDIGKSEEVPRKVSDTAIAAVKQSQSDMGYSEQTVPPYKFKSLDLINFEAYKNAHIDFSEDITLFVGESGNGKSSILRALYWIIENEGKALNFIHKDSHTNSVEVILTLDNGTKITRYASSALTRSGSLKLSENGYRIEAKGQAVQELNTEGVQVVDRLLGFSDLLVDEKTHVPINFLKQGDGWYFINMKAPERAKVIGAIYKTQYIGQAIKDLESKRKTRSRDKKEAENEVLRLTSSLLPFRTLDEQQALLLKLKKENQSLQKDQLVLNKAKQNLKILKNQKLEEKKLLSQLKAFDNLDKISNALRDLSNSSLKYQALNDHFVSYKRSKTEYRVLSKQLASFSNLKKVKDGLLSLEKLQRDVPNLKTFIASQTKIKSFEKIISVLNFKSFDIDKLRTDYEKVNKGKQDLIKYKKLVSQYRADKKALDDIDKDYEKFKLTLPKVIKEGVRWLDDEHIEVFTEYKVKKG